jgi:hypothetical protein
MSALDLLKGVVDAMAIGEPSIWGEPHHASVGILVAGRRKT